MKPVIGLTGRLGSGKSLVAKKLSQLGACIVDMDKIGRLAVEHNRSVQLELEKAFGRSIFDEHHNLRRKKLADIVFVDERALARLNSIVHPTMLARARELIVKEKKRKNCLYIIVDAALLFEIAFQEECDFVVCVTAPLEVCLDRAEQFKNQSRRQALDRIRSQMPQEEKAKRSDYILENNSGLDHLDESVNKLHTWIMHKTTE